MKKFKELLFLSNISRLSTSKINNEYVDKLSRYKTFDDLYNYLKKDFAEDKLEKAMEKSEKILTQLEENPHVQCITILDKEYPQKIKDMGSRAPLFFYVLGNADILNDPNLAVIGTRKPGLDSQNFEYKLTREIIEQTERVIVSGLALGCDKIAHTAAIDMRHPTAAFLPCGFNRIEPENNRKIASGILQFGGCLASTFPPNKATTDDGFTTRNEFVALMADCALAIQCGEVSGTMTTVGFARDYNRKIATFLPEDTDGEDFSGNEFILKNIYNSFKISSLDDLDDFIDFLNAEDVEQTIVCNTKDQKQLILKVNADGQCTFEFQ